MNILNAYLTRRLKPVPVRALHEGVRSRAILPADRTGLEVLGSPVLIPQGLRGRATNASSMSS